ncbi:protein FAM98B isoform X5 [Bubalus kerabau]|uniref:protein FAM98B isoform X5 n=1 Tax=Bubalus carabanensis TaxID=3119969 RepID=UPI00244E74B6|nr:protein FAM98B isoform X5 [Bubalus carabanensis]
MKLDVVFAGTVALTVRKQKRLKIRGVTHTCEWWLTGTVYLRSLWAGQLVPISTKLFPSVKQSTPGLSRGSARRSDLLEYKGPLLEEQALTKAAESGLSSPEFSELCVWLSSQIKSLCNLEESITSAGRDDLESFQLEISGFLKEMACPYSVLISGDIKDRLKKKDDCLKLLLFLSTELQALQILQNKKCKNSQLDKNSEIYQEVQAICDTLGIPKSTTSDIPLTLNQVESKVKDILSKVQKNHVGKPLLKIDLNLEQAEKLERINDALSCEYECRRRMLMKRLDVTVQSFGWSDRAKISTSEVLK